MRSKKKFIVLLIVVCLVLSISLGCVLTFRSNKDIDKILSNESYSYLPKQAKNYIKDIYDESGKIVLTEKNKEENKPYLNPEYIEYLKLNAEQREKVELIPDTYILDYSVTQSYNNSSLPSSFDLRNQNGYNFVSPIKNQGRTGVCWAFASIENVETLYMKNNKQSYSDLVPKFSVRQMDYATSTDYLVKDAPWISCSGSCSWYPWENVDNGSRKLGEGGNFFTSSIIMSNGLSLTDESVLPWTEKNEPKWPKDIMGYDKSLYEVNSTINMPTINADSASPELINSYVSDIKRYMMEYGGPFVGTYSPQSTCGFENIDGTKMLKTDDCVSNVNNKNLGHAMQIIGWDDNYEYLYCESGTNHYSANSDGTCRKGEPTKGKGAWIIRNSWGNETVETQKYSYVYLTYDSTRLSVGFTTSISDMKTRTWDNNYHENPWIERKISNGMLSTNNQTKEFNTQNDYSEKIEKIKFLTSSKNGKYNISILTENKNYDNIAIINTNEAGFYTVDLSDKNIILEDKIFSVKVEGENEAQFFNDSISVFTSNVYEESYIVTSSTKAYDTTKSLSDNNPLYIDLYYNNYKDIYSWDVTINSYLKNLPQYAELSYRLRKNDVIANNFGDKKIYYDGEIAIAEFDGVSNVWYSNFSIKNELGETWIMEIIYNDEIVNSFPIKFNTVNKKTKSNVRLYANHGDDYYFDYSATDRAITKFSDLNGNEKFYNDGYYITSWNTEADGSGLSFNSDEGVLVYKNMELYAQWSNKKLNAEIVYKGQESYCSDCIKGTMESEFYGYDDVIQFPINQFTKDGYVFKNWKTKINSSISEAHYEQEKMNRKISEILNKPVFNNTQIIVYATWTDNYVTISFDANGGTGIMTSVNIEPHPREWGDGDYIEDAIKSNRIKENLFTKDGYIFDGWNTKANGTGTFYENGQFVEFTENQILYAQWEEEYSFKINKYSFDKNKKYLDKIDINTTVDNFKKNIDLNVNYSVDVDNKDNLLYTGGKTRIFKNNVLYDELTNIIRGEVTGDGKLNYLDYVNVYNHIQKVKFPESTKKELINEYLIAADMSDDGKVNYLDYVMIYNKIKELKGGNN